MITSLSFAYLQYSPTTAATAARPAAAAPTKAPNSVTRDDCRGHCDTPRRSPLFRALKDALMEMSQTAKSAAGTSATGAAAADTTAVTSGTAATNQTAAADDASPDLEDALMEFARTLMQVMRDEFGSRRERTRGHDEGHGHRHHHHGHGRWGDPAQRVEALAQQVSAPAPAVTRATSAVQTPASPAVGDVATEPVNSTAVAGAASEPAASAATAGTSSTVIVVASIQVTQAGEAPSRTSPFAGIHQRLLDAFATLQKAMGKPEVASGDALKSELATFLQALAARLRGEDTAAAEAATQPGAMLNISA